MTVRRHVPSMRPHLYVIWCDGSMNAVITRVVQQQVVYLSVPHPSPVGFRLQKVPFSAITWVSTHQLAIQLSLDVMNSGE